MAARTLEIIIKGKDQASSALGGVAGSLGKIGKAATVMGATVATAGSVAGGLMLKLAADAAPLEGIQNAFEGIAERSGSSMDEMLGALQKGSQGMISQRDLMESYNSAAMLVSDTFAGQLPDAMQYLTKVSASTGEDMGFMLDSLVTGVGRLSPMILDNLGIQVDMVAANETWADSMGRTVESMTKSEQQAALMNQVLDLLEGNVGDLPDITDNAATKMAQFSTKITDLKDNIGMALLPILSDLLDSLLSLAGEYLPKVTTFISEEFVPLLTERLIPAISDVVGWFAEKIPPAFDTIKGVWDNTLSPIFNNILGWVTTNLPIIRDTITGKLNEVRAWVDENWPKVRDKIEEVLGGARDWVDENWPEIRDKVQDVLQEAMDWADENFPLFETTITTALNNAITWTNEHWPEIQAKIEEILVAVEEKTVEYLGLVEDHWETVGGNIQTSVDTYWPEIQSTIETTSSNIYDFVSGKLGEIQEIWDEHGGEITNIADLFWDALYFTAITGINSVRNVFKAGWLLIQGDFEGAWDEIKTINNETLDNASEWVSERQDQLWDAFRTMFNEIPKIMGDIAGPMHDATFDVIQALIDAVNERLADIEEVVNKIKEVIASIGDILIPDINLPTLPSLPSIDVPWGQHGGFTQGGLVMTHPGEALIPLNNQSGINALAEAMRQAAGNTFNLTANYSNQPRDSLASDVRMLQLVYGR